MSIAEKITRAKTDFDEVYNAGYNKGQAEGGSGGDTEAVYNKGFEAGERDVWNVIQQGGVPKSYYYAFFEQNITNPKWTDETFKPIYDFICTNCNAMFRGTGITDLPALLERRGIILDTSRSTDFSNFVAYSKFITHIGIIDTTSASGLGDAFRANWLVTIDKLILKNDGSQALVRTFQDADSLVNITIEGVIGKDIDLSYSPLSVDSTKSVILHLMNFNGTGNEFTKLVKFSNACWNALEADSTAPSGDSWKYYVNSLGWNT